MLFIFLASLLCLRPFSTVFNQCWEHAPPVLSLICGGKQSSIKYGVSCRLLKIPIRQDVAEPFYHRWLLNFIKYFPASVERIQGGFLYSVNVVECIFLNVEPTLHSWDNLPRLWCVIHFMYCWILFIKILSWDLCFYIHEGYGSVIFLAVSPDLLWYQGYALLFSLPYFSMRG